MASDQKSGAEMVSDQNKKKKTEEDKKTEIPTELIHDILARLPVKPLCRFRCVSKTWKSLTFDPNFVKMHLNKALEHHHVLRQRSRVLVSDAVSGHFYTFNLDQLLNHHGNAAPNDALVVTQVDRVGDFSSGYVFCCNSLMLFCQSNGRFTVFNPGTRECKLVPKFPKFNRDTIMIREIYGFGFDESTQDYKMVYGTRSKMKLRFSVYSLKTGSWRVMETEYDYQIALFGEKGSFLKGAVHWLAYDMYGSSMVLLSFDLAKETVREMPLPSRFYLSAENFRLRIFRGCLCLNLKDNGEVYIMKKYGVGKSWTRMWISIPPCKWLHSGFRQKHYDLLQMGERLVLCNFDEKTERNLSINGVQKVGYFAIYLESLVSPNHFSITD